MLRTMHVRALCFDLFDTLVDLHMDDLPEYELDGEPHRGTQPEIYRALPEASRVGFDVFAYALRDVDRELRASLLAEGRELRTIERFRALTARLGIEDPRLPEQLTQAHMRTLAARATTPTHHAKLLAELSDSFAIALCSNFSHAPTARRILSDAQLQPAFSSLAISEEVGFRKPRHEIFAAVVAGLEVEPCEILHVGDRLEADVRGATEAGFRTAWLTRRVTNPAEQQARYGGPAPDMVITDLAELRERLVAPPPS